MNCADSARGIEQSQAIAVVSRRVAMVQRPSVIGCSPHANLVQLEEGRLLAVDLGIHRCSGQTHACLVSACVNRCFRKIQSSSYLFCLGKAPEVFNVKSEIFQSTHTMPKFGTLVRIPA